MIITSSFHKEINFGRIKLLMAYHRQKKKTKNKPKIKRNFMGIAFEVHNRHILSINNFVKSLMAYPTQRKRKQRCCLANVGTE